MLIGKYLTKYYKKFLPLFIIGILALLVVDYISTEIPLILGDIVNNFEEYQANQNELLVLILRVVLYALGIFAGRIIWRICIFRASVRIQAGLRRDMFLKAERLSTSYYHNNKVGNIMAWFTTDIETIGDFFSWGTVMLIDAFFMTGIVIFKMITVSGWLTLFAAIPILLIMIWGFFVEKIMGKQWEDRQVAFDRLYDFANENFTGIRVIKAFVKEHQEINAFRKVALKNKEVNYKFAMTSVVFDVILESVIFLVLGLIFGLGAYFAVMNAHGNPVVIAGTTIDLRIGDVVAFSGLFDSLIWPMIALGQIVIMRSRSKTSLKRITHFLDTPEDIQNPENPIILKKAKGEIEFRNFTFQYPDDNKPILNNISFKINPGEVIGIVGRIGEGKTTIMNILMRLYNVVPNSVFIDGNDIMQLDIESLRNNIAYAPQDNFLFSDKISKNIAFSVSNEENSMIVEAAKFADVHSNINEFPNGYDTVSGERGVTLSGGQKQRISLARAFYKHAPIMIMDDTVSAVDIKTEENILDHIANERKGMTTIVIASRVSTVKNMDKILVLADGGIDGFGSHDELIKTSKVYQKMVFLQQLEEEVEGGKK